MEMPCPVMPEPEPEYLTGFVLFYNAEDKAKNMFYFICSGGSFLVLFYLTKHPFYFTVLKNG